MKYKTVSRKLHSVLIFLFLLYLPFFLSLILTPSVKAQTPYSFSKRVSSATDDCWANGNMGGGFGTNLYMTFGDFAGGNYSCGARWTDVTIARRAEILSANITFTASSDNSGTVVRTNIYGEASDDASTFSDRADWDARGRTINYVAWDGLGSWLSGLPYTTVDITDVIQEIVNRTGWGFGNSLVLFFQDDGSDTNAYREGDSYDSTPAVAPLLQIETYEYGIYEFHGLYNETSGLFDPSGVNVTAYFSDSYFTETFEVNGTYSYSTLSKPLFFLFDLSANDREYWLSDDETSGTFYILEDSTTVYTIGFLDLANALDDYPFVEAQYYINGTLRTVERRRVDVEDKVTMSLVNGHKYNLVIENGSTYTYGDLAMTSTTTVQLTLTGVDFPKETLLTYKYVRIYGEHHDWRYTYGSEAIDQEQTTEYNNMYFCDNRYLAQSYTMNTIGNQTKVELYVRKVGSPPNAFTVEVRTDNGDDEPDMTSGGLVANASVAPAGIPTSKDWVSFNHDDFNITASLYWLVARTTGGSAPSNMYYWYYNEGDPYPSGEYLISTDGGLSWTSYAGNDYTFRVYSQPYFEIRSISVLYEDTLQETNSVDLYFNYKNGSNAYNATETADTFNHTWVSARADTDYWVEADINHTSYGTYTWRQYFPRSYSDPPFGLSFLGGGGLPFMTNILLPSFLIVCAMGCFSVLNAEVGAFVGVVTAGILTYMGWIDISAGFLITAFSFAILMGLIYSKRRVTTI